MFTKEELMKKYNETSDIIKNHMDFINSICDLLSRYDSERQHEDRKEYNELAKKMFKETFTEFKLFNATMSVFNFGYKDVLYKLSINNKGVKLSVTSVANTTND